MKKFTKEQKEYQDYVSQKMQKPPYLQNAIMAFLVGGLICTLGQVILNILKAKGLSLKDAGAPTAAIMVFIGAFLTGVGLYDDIGKRAGAGSIVPITGFANSIVSPAMEFKREGYVFGVASKIFVIAGPVIVYGLSASVVIGLIYFFVR